MPGFANESVRLPSAPVVLPLTVAPAWRPSRLDRRSRGRSTGAPVVASPGPASLSTCVLLNASKTQSDLVAVVDPGAAAAGLGELEVAPRGPRTGWCWRLAGRPALTREVAEARQTRSASQVKPLRRAPSSSAAVAVGTGDGMAPALVPSQGCGPPVDGVVIDVPVGGHGAVEDRGRDAPSTRRFTETGAAPAAGAATAARRERGKRAPDAIGHVATLSSRVVWRTTGARSPGLGLNAAPSRDAVGTPVASATHQRPFTVAGPRRLRTGLPSTTGR